jgi:LPXTG-motif cell wall-anchored protein
MARIKEPYTHDYVFYGIVTVLLAACVVGLHYYYWNISGFENKLSQMISDARNSLWIPVIGLAIIAALSFLFLHRRKNRRHRRVEHTSETSTRVS